ncbi:redoxin domain-containing protein [Rhodopirellula sp. P2]|uniref:redoxin domain-containing protein n=1 Tax=Rhodopirellula sp. P2 TaxID=2127060 RepID=UPI002367714F|nr:redoxin domain-containing protein [Rhodopirellula sp. P2]WDQ19029.1 redoxin domain-containing protein [Rhodopirellula sp. P2]
MNCVRFGKWLAQPLLLWCIVFLATPSVSHAQDKPSFELSEDVREALTPLFSRILKADVSRATVDLSAETVMGGEVVETVESVYEIASKYPDQYTIYYKSADDRKRLYSDGEKGVVALTPEAFFRLSEVASSQELATRSELNLGPYPEAVLALTLAGVDPAVTFLGGMKSVEVAGKMKYRGSIDSIHLRGQQKDGVTWDLWISDESKPRPLRLLVDLTPMLIATGQVAVPQGYAYSLRYDFKSWRVIGEVDEKLFQYTPPREAVEYESLEDFQQQSSEELAEHPLLGESVPDFELKLLDGSTVRKEDLKGKVFVLDFWATWCGPCLQAMPVLAETTKAFADKGVQFYAVNVGESSALVKGFVGEQDWDVPVASDPKGDLIDLFSAKSIPLTLLIAPSGVVEAVHQGYPGAQALKQQFTDELEVLVQGGRIASSVPTDAKPEE